MFSASDELSHCLLCGNDALQRQVVDEVIPYGDGDAVVQINAKVPVLVCAECGFRVDAESAETVRHEAICHALGRLCPREIREIRTRLGLSQQQLSAEGGFSVASLRRWEGAHTIQDVSNDRLLRLVDDPAGREVLRCVALAQKGRSEPRPTLAFQCVNPEDNSLRARQAKFAL